jgi:outer membrane biosynthesis protein TonB
VSSPEQAEGRLREIAAAAQRARSELDRLIGQVEALRASLEAETPSPSPPAPAPGPSPPPAPTPDPTPSPVPEPTPSPVPEPTPPTEPEPVPPPEISTDGGSAARLVAMKLAVDGRSREEIAAELDAKFGSADREAILDDVLARAGR